MAKPADIKKTCLNFGNCRLADAESDVGLDTEQCPCCGQKLVSPHLVTIKAPKITGRTGKFPVSFQTFGKLPDEIFGEPDRFIEVNGHRSAAGKGDVVPVDLAAGPNACRAIVLTGDGYVTTSEFKHVNIDPSRISDGVRWTIIIAATTGVVAMLAQILALMVKGGAQDLTMLVIYLTAAPMVGLVAWLLTAPDSRSGS